MRKDFAYKILALIVAFALWGYVNSERNPNIKRSFNVHVTLSGEGIDAAEITGDKTVAVEISGKKTVVDSVNGGDITAAVTLDKDKEKIEKGRRIQKLDVAVDVRGLDKSKYSYNTDPKIVVVTLESIVEKSLPVIIEGAEMPDGSTFGSVKTSPTMVKISGKESLVKTVKKAAVRPDAAVSGETEEKVVLLDGNGKEVKGLKVTPDSVRVSMTFTESDVTKVVPVSAMVTGTPAYPAKITDLVSDPATVTISGKLRDLANIGTVETETISVEGATQDAVSEKTALSVPKGVKIKGPETVRVTVKIGVAP